MKWSDVPWVIELRDVSGAVSPPRVVGRCESGEAARAAAMGLTNSEQFAAKLITIRFAAPGKPRPVACGYRFGGRLTPPVLAALLPGQTFMEARA